MMGLKLWLLTSAERSWSELAWGCYRSFLNDPLKEARREIISEEGNFVALFLSLSGFCVLSIYPPTAREKYILST